MIVKIVEASTRVNYGKFLVGRLSCELDRLSALPGFPGQSLFRLGGKRRFDNDFTLVLDMQTGEGATFILDSSEDVKFELADRHPHLWVCPLYRPFLIWLGDQGLGYGVGDILALPDHVEITVELERAAVALAR